MVKIYGHYVLIGKNKSTFHRHLVRKFSTTDCDGQNRWTSYSFVRKLYDHFASIHLQRIQSAVARLDESQIEPSMSSICSENDLEFSDSQETASAPASQDNEIFKMPMLPSKKKRRNKDTEIAELQRKLERQREEVKQKEDQLREESKQRHAELMNLLQEQKEQNKRLMDMLSKG